MADALEVGAKPAKLKVNLVRGADLSHTMRRSDGTSWLAGTVVSMVFEYSTGTPDTVVAAVDGADLRFDLDSVEVDAVIAKRPKKVRVWYEIGDVRLLWAVGEAVVTK